MELIDDIWDSEFDKSLYAGEIDKVIFEFIDKVMSYMELSEGGDEDISKIGKRIVEVISLKLNDI